jgi:hypothetical protein
MWFHELPLAASIYQVRLAYPTEQLCGTVRRPDHRRLSRGTPKQRIAADRHARGSSSQPGAAGTRIYRKAHLLPNRSSAGYPTVLLPQPFDRQTADPLLTKHPLQLATKETMPSHLESLPPELLLQALSWLPIRSLLSLAQANHHLHTLSQTAMASIHLAIFPKRLHTTLSLLDSPDYIQNDVDHHVAITLPPACLSGPGSPAHGAKRLRTEPSPAPIQRLKAAIATSNTMALDILTPYRTHLRTVSLLLWSPTPETLSFIATSLPSLRTLNLHFSHQMHRDIALPAFYFETLPKPSSMWNSLCGIGNAHQQQLRLRGLEKLSIERAGMTSAQLRGLVAANPRLRDLRLKCVRGVDREFVRWLGDWAGQGKGRMESLSLTDCQALSLGLGLAKGAVDVDVVEVAEELGWITRLVENGLRDLNILRCEGVDIDVVKAMNAAVWRLAKLDVGGLDRGRESAKSDGIMRMGVLEVDPDCW